MTFVLNLAILFSLSLARFKATAKKAVPSKRGDHSLRYKPEPQKGTAVAITTFSFLSRLCAMRNALPH